MPKENASLAKTDIVIKFKHLRDIMTISNAKEFLIHLSAYNAKDTVLYTFSFKWIKVLSTVSLLSSEE